MVKTFKQGDIIMLNFSPQAGHEMKDFHPAIIVSNNTFNKFTRKAAIVCPITSTDKNFPLHVKLDHHTKTKGVIKCEQVKSFDLEARGAKFIEKAPMRIVREVIDIVYGLIE